VSCLWLGKVELCTWVIGTPTARASIVGRVFRSMQDCYVKEAYKLIVFYGCGQAVCGCGHQGLNVGWKTLTGTRI
jgi:hypothetical protein